MRWRYNADHSRITATQTAYNEKAAKTFNLDPDAKTGPKTPMDDRIDVGRDDLPEPDDVDQGDRTYMKKKLGSMLFSAGWCRPECCYPVTRLSRYATARTTRSSKLA